MSTSDFSSRYDFSFEVNDTSGTTNFIAFEFLSRGVMDDTMAFALMDAVKGLAWPTGTTVDAAVSKQDVTAVSYATDLASTPPSFA